MVSNYFQTEPESAGNGVRDGAIVPFEWMLLGSSPVLPQGLLPHCALRK